MSTISKRLHISGLTPSLSAADLSSRLSAFGLVTDVNGFGNVDANGDPKKFAYLTLEATEDKLKRCLSGISGTVWKGAKLRVGEAKPDYKERIQLELNEFLNGTELPSCKRRRIDRQIAGSHAKDMNLVTHSILKQRTAWKVDPLTCTLLRPMRLRPTRPIQPDMPDVNENKRNKRNVCTRTRIKKIDPSLWGNIHLRAEDFSHGTTQVVQQPMLHPDVKQTERVERSQTEDAQNKRLRDDRLSKQPAAVAATPPAERVSSPSKIQLGHLPINTADRTEVDISVEEEKNRTLSLLKSMFGASDNWGGQEALDSEDEDTLPNEARRPHDKGAKSNEKPEETFRQSHAMPSNAIALTPVSPQTGEAQQASKPSLKDMFKPQELEGGFSLFNDMDLDLDFDPTMDALFSTSKAKNLTEPATGHQLPQPQTVPAKVQLQAGAGKREIITLDPSLPFFFPYPGNPTKDIAHALESKLNQKFCRTESSDEIKQRWNERKGELTRDWKKRHREALKARRLRGAENL